MKEFFSGVAVVLTFMGFVPYIRGIWRGEAKPHVFSWVIWGTATVVVFFAQWRDGGGWGAWPIGLSGVLTLYVAGLAYRLKSDTTVARMDWVFFGAAMASLPVWYFTSNPLWAVVLLTLIDLMGFGPTLRKAYRRPFEEPVLFYVIFGVRNVMAVAATGHYSWTTLLFPVATGVACLGAAGVVGWRRKMVGK